MVKPVGGQTVELVESPADDDRVATCLAADPGGVWSVLATRAEEDRRRKSLRRVKVAGSEW